MLVAVCSLKGSPGVTTFAVALAVRWPQPARCVVVECDPSGGDLATRFALAPSPGLVSLAAAARRRTDPGLLWEHTQVLPGGLPVVAAPPGAHQALAAVVALTAEHPAAVEVLNAAAQAGVVVVVDCGRVDPRSPALPIALSADAMVVLSRAQGDDLAHLAARLTAVGRWSRRPALLLAGSGYPTGEVERELGVPVLARVPEDRRGAAALRGQPGGRGPSRSPLGRVAARVAVALTTPTGWRPGSPVQSGSVRSAPYPLPAHAGATLRGAESASRNGSPS